MRHHIVTRIVVSLVVLFVAAVALFAWRVTRPVVSRVEAPVARAETASGQMLFARHCAMCHEAGEVGIGYREAADREAAVAAFREFLAEHHGPSSDGIARIVSYVMEPDGR